MKVFLLFFLTFQWTKNTCGLHRLVFENYDNLSDDTVVLDGAGVGSSANEHESHILFPNTASPLKKDTTLKTSRETTQLTTKTKTIRTSKKSTILTTVVNTRLNTKETIILTTEKKVLSTTERLSLPSTGKVTQLTTGMSTQPSTGMSTPPTTGMGTQPTTEMSTHPTTGKSMLPTTGKSMLPTTGMSLLTTTGKITLPIRGKVTMRTTSDMSLITTEETTLPTTVAPTSFTSQLTTVSATATTTNPLTSLFRDCGEIGSHIKSGRLNSFKLKCASERQSSYCMLIRNTTARIFVNLTSNVDATKVKTIVHARKDRESYPLMLFRHLAVDDGAEGLRFLGIKEDACLHKNVDHCNIKSGEDIQYSYAAFIDPNFPLRRLVIKLEIRDDQDRNLACVRFPIEIVD